MNHENIKYEKEKIDYKHEIAQGCHWEIQVCHFSQNTEFPIKTTELFKPKSTSTSCIRKNWLQEHGLRKIGHFRPYPHSLFGHF